jgi:hypothetical protein
MSITLLQEAIKRLNDVPPQTPFEVIRGVTIRRKKKGLTVMRIHYTAIPDRDPETPKGKEWFDHEYARYASKAMWRKEQEIDAYATGGEAVFGSVLGNEQLYQVVVISDPLWSPYTHIPGAGVVAGFDHGVTNATAMLKGYVPRESFDPKTGRRNPPELYLCGEFYRFRSNEWQNNVDENVAEMKQMPDLERARWIKADPSIFYDAVATDKGAPTNIYQTYKKNNMWPMTPYDGVRSDVTFVEWVMSDWWRGIANGRKPRLYIVCRNPSDRPQPGLHPYDCPNLLWEMKRAKRVQMTSRQLLTKNPSEALQNKNNHLCDCFKQVLGTLRNPTEIPVDEEINEALAGLDAATGSMPARFLMSKLALQGKIDPQTGKPRNKKGARQIDLRRAPGVVAQHR